MSRSSPPDATARASDWRRHAGCRKVTLARSAVRRARARRRHVNSALESRRTRSRRARPLIDTVTGAPDRARDGSTLRYASTHAPRTAGQVYASQRSRAAVVSRPVRAGSPSSRSTAAATAS